MTSETTVRCGRCGERRRVYTMCPCDPLTDIHGTGQEKTVRAARLNCGIGGDPMTGRQTYFTAPDGHGDETLWVMPDEPPDLPANPLPVMRRKDLTRGQQHHWDTIVARVVAGELTAQQQWALNKATEHEHVWHRDDDGTLRCGCGRWVSGLTLPGGAGRIGP